MRRHLLILSLLGVAFVLFWGCREYFPEVDHTFQQEADASSNDRDKTAFDARRLFENNFSGISLLDFSECQEQVALGTKAESASYSLTIHWDDERHFETDREYLIDFPITADQGILSRRLTEDEQGSPIWEQTEVSIKLVFSWYKEEPANIACYVTTLIPTEAFVKDERYNMSEVNSIPTNQNFSGLLFYSHVNGGFISGARYIDGVKREFMLAEHIACTYDYDHDHWDVDHDHTHDEHCQRVRGKSMSLEPLYI